MVEQKQTVVSKMMGPPAFLRKQEGGRPMPATIMLTPKEVFGILRRHILLIVSLSVLGFVVGGMSWYLLRMYLPKYTATTFIKVLPPVEKDPMTIAGGSVARDVQYGNRVSYTALMTQQSSLQRLIDRNKVQETKWFKNFGEVREISIAKAVDGLKKNFSAWAQRDGDYIVVSMTCGNAAESALIVNEMVELFIASQRSTKRGDIAEKLARLQDQRDSIQKDLDAAERALGEVRDRWGITGLEDYTDRYSQQPTATLRLNNLEIEQSDLAVQIMQLQSNMESLGKLATGPVGVQVENQIEGDPILVMLAQQLALMQIELGASLTKFGENHRVVHQIRERIDEIREKRQIRQAEIAEQTRQANFKNAQSQLAGFQQRYAELERLRQEALAKQRDLDLARIQYRQRASIRDERKQMLDAVKAQMEKLKIMLEDPETPKVQFVGPAPVPLEMSSPKWQFYFPGGTMLGFMFGVGLAFLIELLNDLVRTPRDVSRYLHIPLLGVIPDADEDEQVRDIDLCHVVRQAPYSIISESYRRLRTNLKLSGPESLKVLLVASGMAGDGKTSVAVNLVTTFVAENKKVLLIDANFWQPALYTIFPKEAIEAKQAEFGLSTLLVGRCGYQEVIRPSGVEGLFIIDSGPLPSNPAELLGGAQMKQLVEQQRGNYDYIIVDGPPILLVSVAKILAKLVDGTILVFNAAATRRGVAQRTISELREVDAAVVGCVLLGVRAMKGGYFHEQFRSYEEYQKLQLAHSI